MECGRRRRSRSGFDVGVTGVGLAAAGGSAEVPGDAAICRTNDNGAGEKLCWSSKSSRKQAICKIIYITLYLNNCGSPSMITVAPEMHFMQIEKAWTLAICSQLISQVLFG